MIPWSLGRARGRGSDRCCSRQIGGELPASEQICSYIPITYAESEPVHYGVLVQHNLRSVRTPIGAMEHPGEGLGYYDYTAGDTASSICQLRIA